MSPGLKKLAFCKEEGTWRTKSCIDLVLDKGAGLKRKWGERRVSQTTWLNKENIKALVQKSDSNLFIDFRISLEIMARFRVKTISSLVVWDTRQMAVPRMS